MNTRRMILLQRSCDLFKIHFPFTLKFIRLASSFHQDTNMLPEFGCSENEVLEVVKRQPSLAKYSESNIQSKINVLRSSGFTNSDLVKIITCRPRILSCNLIENLDQRLNYLQSFFGSNKLLLTAVVRNPSLLSSNIKDKLTRCVALYASVGIPKEDMVSLIISRPMIISKSCLNKEKLELVHATGLSKSDKMYKHVVTILAISRLETLREKFTNFEKFGFSTDEVMRLFARNPLVFTLSLDKVQRNMTYIIGTMKLPPSIVFKSPFPLFANLELILKPRFTVATKIRSMCLLPQIIGHNMIRALRMTEPRFVKAFISCHSKDIADSLMESYVKAKGMKRLAETSKVHKPSGYPF